MLQLRLQSKYFPNFPAYQLITLFEQFGPLHLQYLRHRVDGIALSDQQYLQLYCIGHHQGLSLNVRFFFGQA